MSGNFELTQMWQPCLFLFFPRCKWIGRLLGYVAVHCGENRTAEILVHILQGATNTSEVKICIFFSLS